MKTYKHLKALQRKIHQSLKKEELFWEKLIKKMIVILMI